MTMYQVALPVSDQSFQKFHTVPDCLSPCASQERGKKMSSPFHSRGSTRTWEVLSIAKTLFKNLLTITAHITDKFAEYLLTVIFL